MRNGKGDLPRPVDRDKYDSNYDQIDWSGKREKDDGRCKTSERGSEE